MLCADTRLVENVRIDTMVIKIIIIKNDSGRRELDTRNLQNDLGEEERDLKVGSSNNEDIVFQMGEIVTERVRRQFRAQGCQS